jgi:translocation and assembly module TamB
MLEMKITQSESGQAQSAAQGAALALVNKFAGKNVAKTVGIDEVSIQSGAGGEQLVSLGKNISDRLTLGYKQSLTGAEAALELTYRLSQKWSVAAQGGRILGLNVTYSTRFDSLKETPKGKGGR